MIPFAVLERDIEEACKFKAASAVPAAMCPVKIAYVGAGGPVMQRAFRFLCKALASLRGSNNALPDRVRIELFGTMLGWRDSDPRYLANIAREEGVADMVSEDPRRVSYRRSVELLLEADGTLVLGVDDPGYMPSKLFAYALSGKPMLAVLRRDSAAFEQFQATPGLGHTIWFDQTGEQASDEVAEAVGEFLRESAARTQFDRRAMLDEFLAPAMACRHAALFEACLHNA